MVRALDQGCEPRSRRVTTGLPIAMRPQAQGRGRVAVMEARGLHRFIPSLELCAPTCTAASPFPVPMHANPTGRFNSRTNLHAPNKPGAAQVFTARTPSTAIVRWQDDAAEGR